MSDKFIFCPLDVIQDPRLSKIQIKVLLCIISFHDRKSNDPIQPKIKTICERVGYSQKTISRATSDLVNLGWLTKIGKGGFSKSCEYKFHVPESFETVTESGLKTVTKPVTIDKNNGDRIGATTVTESGLKTVTEPVTRNITDHINRPYKQTIDIGKKKKSTRFVKPSLDEIKQYCLDRGNNVDHEKFYYHYESNGWKVGKNAMKNWRAAISTWERNTNNFKQGNNNAENKPDTSGGKQQSYFQKRINEAIPDDILGF